MIMVLDLFKHTHNYLMCHYLMYLNDEYMLNCVFFKVIFWKLHYQCVIQRNMLHWNFSGAYCLLWSSLNITTNHKLVYLIHCMANRKYLEPRKHLKRYTIYLLQQSAEEIKCLLDMSVNMIHVQSPLYSLQSVCCIIYL